MPLHVTFDADDPHALAAFWAVALDWKVNDLHDLIGGVIEAGHVAADSDDIIEIDGRRSWRDYSTVTPDGTAPTGPDAGDRVLFIRVPESKTAKNRVHLDVHVADGRAGDRVAALLELGATKLWDGRLGPDTWVTLADPEGNEFCVS
jgi:hypothetical protein